MTFVTGYNGNFNVKISNYKFYFKKTFSDGDDFIQITIPQVTYEIESLNNEIKRIIIDEEHYTEANYPLTIKAIFSKLGSVIEISQQGPIISFMQEDSIRDLLRFHATTLHEEYNLSPNPVDILSIDNIFIECDIAQGKIYRGKRSLVLRNLAMDVDLGYKYIEKKCVLEFNGL